MIIHFQTHESSEHAYEHVLPVNVDIAVKVHNLSQTVCTCFRVGGDEEV